MCSAGCGISRRASRLRCQRSRRQGTSATTPTCPTSPTCGTLENPETLPRTSKLKPQTCVGTNKPAVNSQLRTRTRDLSLWVFESRLRDLSPDPDAVGVLWGRAGGGGGGLGGGRRGRRGGRRLARLHPRGVCSPTCDLHPAPSSLNPKAESLGTEAQSQYATQTQAKNKPFEEESRTDIVEEKRA